MEEFDIALYENKGNFILNYLESCLRLAQVLSEIYQCEDLRSNLILKGGCAVECYLGAVKRLFLDIDLDFNISHIEDINDERNILREKLFQVMKRLNYNEISSKSRYSYSLDSFKFPYKQQSGNLDYLKLEINYSNGEHLYPTINKKWQDERFLLDAEVSILNLEELLGMKMKVLLNCGRPKDLFDVYQLIHSFPNCDIDLVRKAYLFYFALSNRKYTLAHTQNILDISNRDIIGKLYPSIPRNCGFNLDKVKKEVLDFSFDLLQFTTDEKEFLSLFQQGYYCPEFLFNDEEVIKRAKNCPIANYKMMVKNYY